MADDSSSNNSSIRSVDESPDKQTQSQLVSGPRTVGNSRRRNGGLPTKQQQQKKRKEPPAPAKRKSSNSNTQNKKKTKSSKEDAAAVVVSRNRNKNFSPEEDVLISRAFIAATENECEGANKKGDAFYERVLDKFLSIYKQETAEDEQEEVVLNRTAGAIQNRWTRHINKDVQLFNGYYKRVKESKPSGNNDDDIYNLAMEEYRVQEGSKFRFVDCVHVLYQVPKFNPMINNDKKKTPVNKVNSAPMGADTPRPLGSKAAKKIYKQKIGLLEDATSSASTALAEKRIAAVEKVGKAGETLALVLKRKSERQHYMEMAKFYQSMGDNVQALKLMEKVHEYDRKVEEEDNKAAAEEMKKPAMVEGTNEKPPSVVEVVNSNSNSKEEEEEEQEEEGEEDNGEEEEEEEEEEEYAQQPSSMLPPPIEESQAVENEEYSNLAFHKV